MATRYRSSSRPSTPTPEFKLVFERDASGRFLFASAENVQQIVPRSRALPATAVSSAVLHRIARARLISTVASR
jgi:hypothetical protein